MLLPRKQAGDFNVIFYKYPRVDSFDLYRNYVGDVILKSLNSNKKQESGYSSSKGVYQIKNA
jgi:hypothetical protein